MRALRSVPAVPGTAQKCVRALLQGLPHVQLLCQPLSTRSWVFSLSTSTMSGWFAISCLSACVWTSLLVLAQSASGPSGRVQRKSSSIKSVCVFSVCVCWLTSPHLCRWAEHSDSGLYRFIPHHQDQESAGPEDRPEAILLPVTKVWFLQPDIRTHHR